MNTRLLLAALLLVPGLASGLSGQLDPGFGDDGIVTLASEGHERAQAVALDAEGRIVSAGFSIGERSRLSVVRHLSDGTLDASFDGDGQVHMLFNGDDARAYAVAVQADGKIVAAGEHTDRGPGNGDDDDDEDEDNGTNFALVRFNADGSLDTSFNGTGLVSTDMGSDDDSALDIAIDDASRIVVTGQSGGDFALARYNADGSLDADFGSGGKVLMGIGLTDDQSRGLALQADGKIVVAGRSTQNGGLDTVLVRLHGGGALDGGFGAGGVVVSNWGGDDFGEDVAIQTDGRIVVAGFVFNGTRENIALARYHADGSVDSDFGMNGVVVSDFGNRSEAYGVAVRGDGRIIVAGAASTGGPQENIGLAGYLPDGDLDLDLGAFGLAVIDVDPGAGGKAFDVALQADGKIVVVGTDFGDMAILRILSDDSEPPGPSPPGEPSPGSGADLKVELTAADSDLAAEDTAVFTATVINLGPDKAMNAGAIAVLSLTLTLDTASVTSSTGTCQLGLPLICRFGDLPSGSSATMTYSASSAEGTASTAVNVLQPGQDPNTSNNSSSLSLTVSAPREAAGTDAEGTSASDDGSTGEAAAGGGCSLIRTTDM